MSPAMSPLTADGATARQTEVVAEQPAPRLDRFLADALPALSRSRLKALIEAGHITTGGHQARDASAPVPAGARYLLDLPDPVAAEPQAQAIPLDILYEDDALIVLNKPASWCIPPPAAPTARWLTRCWPIAATACPASAANAAPASSTGSIRTPPASWWSPKASWR